MPVMVEPTKEAVDEEYKYNDPYKFPVVLVMVQLLSVESRNTKLHCSLRRTPPRTSPEVVAEHPVTVHATKEAVQDW